MTITATPTLSVAGLTIAGSLAGAPDLVAVDGLSLTWGRSSVLEDPAPATASLTVLDRSVGATFARRTDLIGQRVELGWTASDGSSGVNFVGRLTDAVAVPAKRGAPVGGGFRVSLAATSVEGLDLANTRLPEGTVWPTETFAARRTRIAALLPAPMTIVLPDRFSLGLPAGAVPGAELDGQLAAPVDMSGQSLLEACRALFRSLAPLPMVVEPATGKITFAGRRRYAYTPVGLTISARLIASAEHGGRYVAASLSGDRLPADRIGPDVGAVAQVLESRLTAVEARWQDWTTGRNTSKGVGAAHIANQMERGGPLFEDWSWRGYPREVADYCDVLLTDFLAQNPGKAWNSFSTAITWLRAFVAVDQNTGGSFADATATAPTVDSPAEAVVGRRVLAVDTDHAEAAGALQTATLYADVANREARERTLAPVEVSTARDPLRSAAHARLLLGGVERSDAVFLAGSWLPQLGLRPLVGFIGGTITYAAGEWTSLLTPAAVIVDPQPFTWAPVTVKASAIDSTIRLSHIDPSVTFGDLGFIDVGAGFDPSTVLPYKGNPS